MVEGETWTTVAATFIPRRSSALHIPRHCSHSAALFFWRVALRPCCDWPVLFRWSVLSFLDRWHLPHFREPVYLPGVFPFRLPPFSFTFRLWTFSFFRRLHQLDLLIELAGHIDEFFQDDKLQVFELDLYSLVRIKAVKLSAGTFWSLGIQWRSNSMPAFFSWHESSSRTIDKGNLQDKYFFNT